MKKGAKKDMELTRQNNEIVDEIARRIASEAPALVDLGEAQLRKIAQAVLFDELKDALRQKADAARIDYVKEKGVYLKKACRSAGTSRVYGLSLKRFEDWCLKNALSPLEISPKDADDFIYAINGEGRSSATVRLNISAVSAFFTWMERRHKSVRNPFRGTRARPKREAKKEVVIPTVEEMKTIIDWFTGSTRAAVIVMAKAGLRVGALPSLNIRDGRYACKTKGKEQKGEMSPDVLKVLRGMGQHPFELRTAGGIAESVKWGMKKLYEAGKIRARYSAHDLRHFYAVQEYRKDKDIYRLKTLLGHASIQVTENYLRGLGY